MKIGTTGFALLFVILLVGCRSKDSVTAPSTGIRLKIPLNPVALFSQHFIGGAPAGTTQFGFDDFKAEAWGFIDKTGRVMIPPRWEEAGDFCEGLAGVKQGNQWGFIDPSGKIIIPCQFDDSSFGSSDLAPRFIKELARVTKNHKPIFIDTSGKEVATPQNANPITDSTSRSRLSPQWEWAGKFSNDLVRVISGHKTGFIDKTGKVVIEPQFFNAGDFCEGLAGFQKNQDDKWGFIDSSGKVVIEPQWHWAGDFSEGLAWVENDDRLLGFIDKTGKVVIPLQWSSVGYEFSHGLITVTSKGYGREGVIDSTGRIVVKPEWEKITLYNEYCFAERFASPFPVAPRNSGPTYRASYPAEAAWFDKTGKMIWHSEP